MQFSSEGSHQGSPRLHQFLGAIVDSAGLDGMTPQVRDGMIQELGTLFQQRLSIYLESVADARVIPELETIRYQDLSDAQVYGRLKSLIPSFDRDLEKLCVAFRSEYGVK